MFKFFNTLHTSYSNKQCQCLQSVHCHPEWRHEVGKKYFQKTAALHSVHKCSNRSVSNFQSHQKRIVVAIYSFTALGTSLGNFTSLNYQSACVILVGPCKLLTLTQPLHFFILLKTAPVQDSAHGCNNA